MEPRKRRKPNACTSSADDGHGQHGLNPGHVEEEKIEHHMCTTWEVGKPNFCGGGGF